MVGIIAEPYENESERSAVLGYYNGVMSGLGAVFFFLAGYLALSFAENVWTAGLVCTILGAMYGLSFSYYLMQASVIVPASRASVSISIVNAAVYLGIFLGPYIPVAYMTAMHRDRIMAILPDIAGTLLICGLISDLVSMKHRHP